MPSDSIQGSWTLAIQEPAATPAGPAPSATKSPRSSPALATHCATSRTSGTAVPATAVQRESRVSTRPSNQATTAATAGMRM